jgi:hypothetical protein
VVPLTISTTGWWVPRNERCLDLGFKLLGQLDWQFDVCPPAVAICHGQHNRATVCWSGANVAHSPISRCCVSDRQRKAAASGLDIPIEASQSTSSHAPTKAHAMASASIVSRINIRRRRPLRPAERSAFEMTFRARAVALRSAACSPFSAVGPMC